MVLRFVLIFILLCSSISLYARSSSRAYFKKAQYQFKKKNYSKSLNYISKGYNLKKPKRLPTSVLFLTAYNYQKLNMYQKSNYYYNLILHSVYKTKHRQVLRAYKKNAVDDIELPKTLGITYLHLGKNYHNLFKKRGDLHSGNKARMYIKICDETDAANECSGLLEKINKDIAQARLKKKGKEFYFQIGRLLFQDRVEIKESSSGITSSLTSNNSSICYGAGMRFGSSIKGYDFSGCILSGTTTVQGVAQSESGTNNNYKQSGVPIAGMLFEAGYYYKFDAQKARVGVNLPLLYRAGSYSEPVGYTITDPTRIHYGIGLSAGIQLPIVELQFKLSNLDMTNSLLINLLYNF